MGPADSVSVFSYSAARNIGFAEKSEMAVFAASASALRPADGLPTGTAESEVVEAPATEEPAAAEVPPGDAKPKRRASFVEPLLEA